MGKKVHRIAMLALTMVMRRVMMTCCSLTQSMTGFVIAACVAGLPILELQHLRQHQSLPKLDSQMEIGCD